MKGTRQGECKMYKICKYDETKKQWKTFNKHWIRLTTGENHWWQCDW